MITCQCGQLIQMPHIPQAPIIHSEANVQTIEQTGKEWKGRQLQGCLVSVASIFIILFGAMAKLQAVILVGMVMFLVGIIYYIYARIKA